MKSISYRIIVANIDRVAKTKHRIMEAFEVGLPVSEVGRRLLQPLAEPLGVPCGLSVSVGRHEKHADRLVGALNGAHPKEEMTEEYSITHLETYCCLRLGNFEKLNLIFRPLVSISRKLFDGKKK